MLGARGAALRVDGDDLHPLLRAGDGYFRLEDAVGPQRLLATVHRERAQLTGHADAADHDQPVAVDLSPGKPPAHGDEVGRDQLDARAGCGRLLAELVDTLALRPEVGLQPADGLPQPGDVAILLGQARLTLGDRLLELADPRDARGLPLLPRLELPAARPRPPAP